MFCLVALRACLLPPSEKKKPTSDFAYFQIHNQNLIFLGRREQLSGQQVRLLILHFFYICLDTLYSLYRNEEHLKELTNRLYISLKMDKQTKTCSNRLVKYRMISITYPNPLAKSLPQLTSQIWPFSPTNHLDFPQQRMNSYSLKLGAFR